MLYWNLKTKEEEIVKLTKLKKLFKYKLPYIGASIKPTPNRPEFMYQ